MATKMTQRTDGPLLQLIPRDRMKTLQQAIFLEQPLKPLPMYELLREPTQLEEFEWDKPDEMLIWRENGSFITVGFCHWLKPVWKQCVHFEIGDLCFSIHGKTNTAMAATATFFWSLKDQAREAGSLSICFYSKHDKRDPTSGLKAIRPGQLAQILDANPTRRVDFDAGKMSAKQSLVLATRSYPLDLRLGGDDFSFLDKGAAFVDTLEKRRFPFGSLEIADNLFSQANLRRLLKLDIFEKLKIFVREYKNPLLPFSAKVQSLDYSMLVQERIDPAKFDTLNIVAKDVTVKFVLLWQSIDWRQILILLLDRVAALGHVERFTLSIDYFDVEGFRESDLADEFEVAPLEVAPPEVAPPEVAPPEVAPPEVAPPEVALVAEALIRAINANQNLTHLDVGETWHFLDWGPYLPNIATAMEEHKALRTFVVEGYSSRDEAEDPFRSGYAWLEQLISNNRNIVVLNSLGQRCSNGLAIDNLYLLNRAYHVSANLLKAPAAMRSLLVAMVWSECASGDFQYAALLLADHTDVLCELIRCMNLEDTTSSDSMPEGSNRAPVAKRKATTHLSPPTKKAAQDEK